MAIQGPTNFRCDKTGAYVGDILTFTWEASASPVSDIAYYEIEIGHESDPDNIWVHSIFEQITPKSGTMSFSGAAKEEMLGNTRFMVSAVGKNYIRGSSNYITVNILPGVGETPAPPEPTITGGRLEQFQNSAGERIYPQTIIEGIFRQSDGKPLSELLSGIELPLRIEEGGTGAGNAQTALANLIDGTDTSFQAASYGDVYIPISINGAGYRMPFTKVQLWTIGDRKSAVNQTNTDYGIFMARGIAAGTSDYAAGSTAMTSGTIYLVYE